MDEEKKIEVVEEETQIDGAETHAADGEADPGEPAPAEEPKERTFTQEQVNQMVGKARAEGREKGYEQAKREALERYGVETDDELDVLFSDGARYGELNSRYSESRDSARSYRSELAMYKSGIKPERQGDVKAILGANGMEVTEENIASLLPTHPEWKDSPAEAPKPANVPTPAKGTEASKVLGAEPKLPSAEEDEYEKAMKAFNIEKR